MSELDLLDDLENYRRLFTDSALWSPRVERALARHGLAPTGPARVSVPGTCPTFIAGERWVVKFFGRLFDGARAFQVELEAARLIQTGVGAARLIQTGVGAARLIQTGVGAARLIQTGGGAARLIQTEVGAARLIQTEVGAARLIQSEVGAARLAAWGMLEEGKWPWPYLIFDYVPGQSIGAARDQLCDADRMAAARWLGTVIRGIHALPLRGSAVFADGYEEYLDFLEAQRAGAAERHRAWASLPAHLLEQIPGFIPPARALVDTSRPAHLIHADLTRDHLLGRFEGGRWQPLALIDFGDAMTGDLLYELGALQLDLFAADRRMLGAFLEAYRLPQDQYAGLPRRALAAALLHNFNLFAELPPAAALEGAATLAELAERLFRPL